MRLPRLTPLALVALVAACELRPAPQQQAAPPPPPPPAPAEPATPAAPRPSDAGSAAPGQIRVTDQCVQIGVHVAGVLIAAATDPGQRSIYEQERAKMVRSTAEVCTTQNWSAEASACYLAAKNPTELKDCEKKFTPRPAPRPPTPTPPTPAPGAGGGMRPEPGAPSRPAAGSAAQPVRRGAGSPAQPARPATGRGTQPARPAPERPARPARAGSAQPAPTGSAAPRP